MSENKLKLNKPKISLFYLFTLGFPSYLIADVLVPGIHVVTEKATEVLLVGIRESDHIHSQAQKRCFKLYCYAMHCYNKEKKDYFLKKHIVIVFYKSEKTNNNRHICTHRILAYILHEFIIMFVEEQFA